MVHSSVTSRAVLAAALAGFLLPFQALGADRSLPTASGWQDQWFRHRWWSRSR